MCFGGLLRSRLGSHFLIIYESVGCPESHETLFFLIHNLAFYKCKILYSYLNLHPTFGLSVQWWKSTFVIPPYTTNNSNKTYPNIVMSLYTNFQHTPLLEISTSLQSSRKPCNYTHKCGTLKSCLIAKIEPREMSFIASWVTIVAIV